AGGAGWRPRPATATSPRPGCRTPGRCAPRPAWRRWTTPASGWSGCGPRASHGCATWASPHCPGSAASTWPGAISPSCCDSPGRATPPLANCANASPSPSTTACPRRARHLAQLLRIARPGDPAAAELRERITLAVHYGMYAPGQVFTDAMSGGGRGPQMAVVPHGAFTMGAAADEPDSSDHEKPAHVVRFE